MRFVSNSSRRAFPVQHDVNLRPSPLRACGAQKLIGNPQDSEIAPSFVVLPGPRGIAFGVPNRAAHRIESLCHVVG
jgi:hypothetical protein